MDTGQNQIAKYKHQQKAGLNDVAKTLSVGLKGKDLHSFTKGMESDIKEDEKDMEEVTGASSSGAYSSPFGGEFKPKKTKPVKKKSSTIEDMAKNYLKEYARLLEEKEEEEEIDVESEEELDEVTGASSSGSFEGPAIWAKNKKNWRAVNDPNFPKYGGPGSTFVKVKDKCKKFPYCNQGDINSLEFYEDTTLKEAIKNVAKKTGKPVNYLKNIILKELEDSETGKRLRKQAKDRVKKYSKKEIEEIIRRGFYKSPITNLVGNSKMNLPIGQLYTMKGNKPKYEG
jgi:hypothetical protein|tara:strand:- start:5615 stop:6469 length:855 start_codon:yes stop_codon:yes gene_type:complete